MITKYFSGNERFQAPYVFRTVHPMCNNNGELAGDSGKENVRLCGQMVSCMPPGNAHVDFKVVNGSFDSRAYFIEAVPFFRIPLDTGKHPQLHVFIGIGCPAFFGSGAGVFTVTYPLPFYHMNLWAAPFDTFSTSFFFGNAEVFHGEGGIVWAGGISVFIVTDFLQGAFIAVVVRDQSPGETEIVQQGTVEGSGVK